MSQIGTLVTGAGVVTTINQNWVPQYILVGDVSTKLPITQLAYSLSGKEKLNLSGQPLIQAFSKFGKSSILGATIQVAQLLEITDGYYGNTQFQLRLTNVGITTPGIFGFSDGMGRGRCIVSTNVTVLTNTNTTFQGFVALGFDATNVNTVDLTFLNRENGQEYQEAGLSPDELNAYFNIQNPSDLAGQLSDQTYIDNRAIAAMTGSYITKARVFNGAGGDTSVSVTGLQTI